MPSNEQLTRHGWAVTSKFISQNSDRITHEELIDTDLREFGAAWIADSKKNGMLNANGRILQLSRIWNVAVPLSTDLHDTSVSRSGGLRLLRLTLTDGHTTISALDVNNHAALSMDTVPGTKIRLMGSLPISVGFLLLSNPKEVQVLGGHVPHFVREWNMAKMAKACEGRFSSGAPPFVPFGTHEAASVVQTELKFLHSLSNRTRAAFNSFELSASNAIKENELDDDFIERRREEIAGVNDSVKSNHSYSSVRNRFKAGGSKFTCLLQEKSASNDALLAQLVSNGYSLPDAKLALQSNRGNFQAAMEQLSGAMAASSLETKNSYRNSANPNVRSGFNGRQQRIGRSGRGRMEYDPREEDDPRFDPGAAAAASGLPSRRSVGVTLTGEFIRNPDQSQSNPAMNPSSQRISNGMPASRLLPVGHTILVPTMDGQYTEGKLIGHVPAVGGPPTKKVALVVYFSKAAQADSSASSFMDQDEYEELVPFHLLRGLNMEKIPPEMIPPAPNEGIQSQLLRNQPQVVSNNFQRPSIRARSFGRRPGRRFSRRPR